MKVFKVELTSKEIALLCTALDELKKDDYEVDRCEELFQKLIES